MTPGFLTWLLLFIWADFLVIILLLFIPTFRKVAGLLGHRSELARFAAYASVLVFIIALIVAPVRGGWLTLGYIGFWTVLISAIIFMGSPFNFLTALLGVIAVWVAYRVVFVKGSRKSQPVG